MTYEQRTSLIGTLLRETILPRYKRPEHLGDDTARAELADMVEDLNRAWPVMTANEFTGMGERLAREIRTTHVSRSWPPIAAMCKALKAAASQPAGNGEKQEPAHVFDGVLAWWREHNDRCPYAKEEHGARLVSEGHATWGQLRRGGFHVPKELADEAKAEPDPNHMALMDGLEALKARMRDNGVIGGLTSAVPVKAPHWSETAPPDDPRWTELRKARAEAPLS